MPRAKDVVTGLDNGNSFIRAQASLPLKYGLGIICIDDYKHLAQIFKKSGIDEIVVMIAKKICELEPDAHRLPLRRRRIHRHLPGGGKRRIVCPRRPTSAAPSPLPNFF